MIKYTLLVALFAVGAYCSEEQVAPFAFGGRDALFGEFASACSIDSPFQSHCNGIVVNERHILTTAQCVMNGTALAHPGWFRVTCGNNNIFVASPGRHVSTVTHLYPHDRYAPANLDNNLAIIRLADPIVLPSNTIEPAVFSPNPVADGAACVYAGWGRGATAAETLLPDKQVINAPIVNRAVCNTMANPNRALDNMVCAGNTVAQEQATCTGNLGGGLYCNNEVVGILSLGTGCGAANTPGIYMQTRLFTAWFTQAMARTDTIPAGTTYPRPA